MVSFKRNKTILAFLSDWARKKRDCRIESFYDTDYRFDVVFSEAPPDDGPKATRYRCSLHTIVLFHQREGTVVECHTTVVYRNVWVVIRRRLFGNSSEPHNHRGSEPQSTERFKVPTRLDSTEDLRDFSTTKKMPVQRRGWFFLRPPRGAHNLRRDFLQREKQQQNNAHHVVCCLKLPLVPHLDDPVLLYWHQRGLPTGPVCAGPGAPLGVPVVGSHARKLIQRSPHLRTHGSEPQHEAPQRHAPQHELSAAHRHHQVNYHPSTPQGRQDDGRGTRGCYQGRATGGGGPGSPDGHRSGAAASRRQQQKIGTNYFSIYNSATSCYIIFRLFLSNHRSSLLRCCYPAAYW